MGKVKSKGVEMRMPRVHPWDSGWKALARAEVDTLKDRLEWSECGIHKVRAPKRHHVQTLKCVFVTFYSKGTLQKWFKVKILRDYPELSKWHSVITRVFIKGCKEMDCVDHNKLWKILKEMGIPDHLTCLLRNLYAGQEATVRTGHETDWFQIGKWVCQGCILSPCLFNFYAEYVMRNAGLEEAQAGIKIARRNIHNLRYADDTTLMAESEEELKNLLIENERGEWKSWLKAQHSEN